MPYVIIRHKVDDYARWKPVFDAGAALRESSDFRGGQLFRNAQDPNELVILLETNDLEKARQFSQSDELRHDMQQAGVAEQPDVYFLEEVEQVPA